MRSLEKLKPINLVPFRLQNIEDFVVGTHPMYYPESQQYDEYWMEQLAYCIEGKWGYDYDKKKNLGGYRWAPGNLYFYANMGIIKQEEEGNVIASKSPILRDIEWLIFYGLTVCDGFSGFTEDPEYCCFRPIGALQQGKPLSVLDTYFLERYGESYRNKKGEYKTYIEAKQYLYRTFKEPAGVPLYHNTALNFEILSTRRLGKSYIIGEGIGTYDFTFNGARTVNDYLEQTTSSTLVIGSSSYSYSGELLDKVQLGYDNLKTNIGAYNKDGLEINGVFWHPSDAFTKGVKQKGGIISNEVTDKSGQGKEGAGSKIVHVSYKDNPSAGVGYGARRMLTEESGLLDNFEAVHGENSATQKHDYKYGYSVYIGTGGNIEKIKGIKDSFYNPGKYDILSYPNLCNPGGNETALFVPVYYKNNNFRDENGNLDIERSFKSELELRESHRGGKNYQTHTISFPMVHSEMFMKSAGNRFNTEALEKRIIDLEEGELKYNVGKLVYIDEFNRKVLWEEDIEGELEPFLRRGDESEADNLQGGIVVYEHPQPYRPSRHSSNPLYITIYDSVDIDDVNGEGGGSSLCSVIVLKLYDFNDPQLMLNVVCEWYGRFGAMDDNHKQAFMIADYYGSKLFPETNIEDILRYAQRIRRYDDLEDRPAYSAAEISVSKRSYAKGFTVPPNGKPKLEEFLNEMLHLEVYKDEFIDKDEYTYRSIRVVDMIPSIRVCEELKDYNSEDNFDAVSCLFLGALYVRNKNLQPISEDMDKEESLEIEEFNSYFINVPQNTRHPAFDY